MNIKEFPKSEALLQEFFKKNLLAFQKNIMKDAPMEGMSVPEITGEMSKAYMESMLLTNTRLLFDFFDENKVYIQVLYYGEKGFLPLVVGMNNDMEHTFPDRMEAEHFAFKTAFEILEKQL